VSRPKGAKGDTRARLPAGPPHLGDFVADLDPIPSEATGGLLYREAAGGAAGYRWVGVCRAGFGGAGGSVGDCWISGGSTYRHGLFAISVLIPRNRLHSASVASESWAPCPLSKHHSCPFAPGPSG
jgi:hypothetical protein